MSTDVQELLAAEAALASRSLVDMGLYTNRRDRLDPTSTAFVAYPHVVLLDRIIRRFLAHPTQKIMLLAAPPRHGKSWTVAKTLPLYYLVNNPDHHVILAGYGASFASTWGRTTRDAIIRHPEFGLTVDPSARSIEHFSLAHPHIGAATFTGVGGSLTGRGAHLFVIDDAIKNSEEALSKTYCQKLVDWFWSTAHTRLEPGGKLIVMQTVWSWQDLYSTLAKTVPTDELVRVEMPAIADGNPYDPTDRQEGEALCPERYPEGELTKIKDASPPWSWSAMYQCTPQAEGSGMFTSEGRRSYTSTPTHYVLQQPDAAPVFLDRSKTRRFVTADLAATTKTSGDYTVFAVWEAALLPDGAGRTVMLLVGCERGRLDSADHLDKAVAVHNRWKPLFVGVENQTYGLTLITQLRRAGIPVIPLPADKDKISRAIPASSAWAAGRVFLPDEGDMPMVKELLEELYQFDKAPRDDFVDCLAYAVLQLDTGFVGPSLGVYLPKPPGPRPGTLEALRAKMKPKAKKVAGL